VENILVIGAHFDDAELAAGGSMARWVSEGKKVYKLTLTDNVTKFSHKNIDVDFESSKIASQKASQILGVEEVTGITISPCSSLNFDKEIMQEIEAFIFQKKIDTLVMHFMHDIQQDHVSASTLSYVAGRYCKRILTYQSNRYILPSAFYPRFFVNISDTLNLKKEALSCYSVSHDRFSKLFDATINQNQLMGFSAMMEDDDSSVESFDIIKYVI